jgi:hypothetical protein
MLQTNASRHNPDADGHSLTEPIGSRVTLATLF